MLKHPNDDHQNLIDRSSGQMRAFVYWCFFGSISTPLIACLLFVEKTNLVLLIAILGLPLAAITAFILTAFVMAPIYALRLNLMVKNYGHDDASIELANLADSAQDVAENKLETWSKQLTAPLLKTMATRLPSEIADIERLARAGRIANLALDSVKKDLFRHLSHQLKSPMAILKAHCETAQDKLANKDLLGANKNLAAIEEVTMNVAGLVEQLLSMAWVESLADGGVNQKKVNLSKALIQVERLRSIAAEEKSITLQTDILAGLWVTGEAILLQEMITALIDNAIQYSPVGSEIKLEAFKISNTRAIAVVVTDQGPGIPKSERDRVFDPFYGSLGLDVDGNMTYGTRRHRVFSDVKVSSSHGLGLSLVRSIARLHMSEVILSDGHEGKGLCARIILSASAAPDA